MESLCLVVTSLLGFTGKYDLALYHLKLIFTKHNPTFHLFFLFKVQRNSTIWLQAPQFVDIHLDEEDSSDEEYRPDEEEEDETAEDVRLFSDCRAV